MKRHDSHVSYDPNGETVVLRSASVVLYSNVYDLEGVDLDCSLKTYDKAIITTTEALKPVVTRLENDASLLSNASSQEQRSAQSMLSSLKEAGLIPGVNIKMKRGV